jgi:hypothetical protein
MTIQERNEMMKEIAELNNKFNTTKKANSVKCSFPEAKRTYTYRKTTTINRLEAVR